MAAHIDRPATGAAPIAATAAHRLVIDREHPWPWLEAFTEEAREFFNGRDNDTEALLRCVLAAPATVLFGKSGLGKTSLVQAGLAPRLRQRRLLPVLVRIDHHSEHSASAQLLTRLNSSAEAAGLHWQGPARPGEASPVSQLWEQLHDRELALVDVERRRWVPVFVLDQFEEAFTLIDDPARQQRLFAELGDLIEGRIPPEVAQRLDAHDELLDRIDADRLGARFVLSLREDYLADLEVWADRIPRLGPNRARLLPMSAPQALAAVQVTGGALVAEADARRIVDFLGRQGQQGQPVSGAASRQVWIEPALLSLICAGLNQHRLDQKPPAAQLDTRSLDTLGSQLLERFYDAAFAALHAERRAAAERFVETELITTDGTRRPFPRDAALRLGLSAADLATLTQKRLLRIDNTEVGDFVELVHDRLALIAAQRAKLAAERAEQAAKEAQRLEQEKRRRQQNRLFAGMGLMLSAVLITGAGLALWQRNQALSAQSAAEESNRRAIAALKDTEKAQSLAEEQSQIAREAKDRAVDSAQEAENNATQAKREAERARVAETSALLAQSNAERQEQRVRLALRDATAQRLLNDATKILPLSHRLDMRNKALQMVLAGYRLTLKSEQPSAADYALSYLQKTFEQLDYIKWSQETREECTALSPDESITLVCSGNQVLLLDSKSGFQVKPPLVGHTDRVNTAAFSPNGKQIVSGGVDNRIILWNIEDNTTRMKVLATSSEAIIDTRFSPDGSIIVSNEFITNTRLWDPTTGLEIKPQPPIELSADELSQYHDDGSPRKFISESTYQRIKGILSTNYPEQKPTNKINRENSKSATKKGKGDFEVLERLFPQEYSGPFAASPNGKYIAITRGDYNSPIRLVSTIDGTDVHQPLNGYFDPVSDIKILQDGIHMLSTSRRAFAATMWAIRDKKKQFEALINQPDISTMALSPSGKFIATGHKNGSLRLWNTIDGTPVGGSLTGHKDSIHGIAFSPDGRYIASASHDKTLRLWDTGSGKQFGNPFFKHAHAVWSVAFSPNGKSLALGDSKGTISIIDAMAEATAGRKLQGHTEVVSSVSYTPDGSRLVSGSWDNTVRIWDPNTGTQIFQPLRGHQSYSGPSNISSIAISPDGKNIVSASWDFTMRLWDLQTGKSIGGPLEGHLSHVLGAKFSPDGEHIASVSLDGTVSLWSTKDGKPVSDPINIARSDYSEVSFSPDGKQLFFRSDDGVIGKWTVLDGWPDALCAKLPRNMSRKEWREWVSPDIDYVVQCHGKPVPKD